MTGTKNGTISIWRNGQISKSIDCNGERPLIKVVGQDIVVASEKGNLLVLDSTLNVKKQYNTIDYEPQCLSATGKYIAIFSGNELVFYDRNGSRKRRVRIKLKK